MPVLSPEAQAKLGPALGLVRFLLAAAFGLAVYHWTGGPPIPFISLATAFVLGIVAFLWASKELKD